MRGICMKRIILLIIITILISITSNVFSADNEKIIGFWTTTFPVPDVVYGYLFNEDGSFYCLDEYPYNIKNKYSGSMGKWKIEKNKIMVKLEYDAIWKEHWIIEQPTGINIPGEKNECKLIKHQNSDWEVIGDIRLYTESIVINEKEPLSKPANNFFRVLMNKNFMDSRAAYWNIYPAKNNSYKESTDVKEIINFFKGVNKK